MYIEVWWQEGYDQKRCNATNVSRIKRVYCKPAEMICGFGIGMQTSARQMRKPTFSLGIKADRLVLAPFGQRNPAIEMCLHMFALMAQTDQK